MYLFPSSLKCLQFMSTHHFSIKVGTKPSLGMGSTTTHQKYSELLSHVQSRHPTLPASPAKRWCWAFSVVVQGRNQWMKVSEFGAGRKPLQLMMGVGLLGGCSEDGMKLEILWWNETISHLFITSWVVWYLKWRPKKRDTLYNGSWWRFSVFPNQWWMTDYLQNHQQIHF